MEPNQNPPSEREWSIAEREDFYAGQDAITGGTIGIYVTHIVPPTYGWPVAMYCPICKETTFTFSPYAIKPLLGEYFKIFDTCGSDVFGDFHNIRLALSNANRMIYEEAKRRRSNTSFPVERHE